ncbi:3-hydroxyacyl-ACP dehydratase FabZ [Iodidimonas sp. SYSU 1G8]|uniref:3-hydroxyacyl-ACP dehydratase FabZ n=1 Tax=Iodidimonas sp. SYSU 1G8 TaxID=3133967 RepID=UPI0031FF1194
MNGFIGEEIVATFDLERIKRLIPHRYPMLLVDKVHVLERGERAIGIKNVTANEPFFMGHFPEKPVMPGVLIIEALAQTAAVLAMDILLSDEEEALVYLTSVDNAKFRQQVVPGDQLHLHVQKEKARSFLWRLAVQAKVDGKVVTEASLSAVIEKRPR